MELQGITKGVCLVAYNQRCGCDSRTDALQRKRKRLLELQLGFLDNDEAVGNYEQE